MSCSHCLNCKGIVPMFEKYCDLCLKKYNLYELQDINFHKRSWTNYAKEREEILKSDFEKMHILNAGDAVQPSLKLKPVIRKINTFTCPRLHVFVTLQQCEGKTHDVIGCLNPNCNMNALSAWNQCDQRLIPQFEWYKPSSTYGLAAFQLEDMEQGILILRPIDESPMRQIYGDDIGRNNPCPCGSGKKYKNCHMK